MKNLLLTTIFFVQLSYSFAQQSLTDSLEKTANEGLTTYSVAIFNAAYSSHTILNEIYDDNYKISDKKIVNDMFTAELRKNASIESVIMIPKFVTGHDFDIEKVNKIAVSGKSDFLICYSIETDSWTEEKNPKALAMVEFILINSKTGELVLSGSETAQNNSNKYPEASDDFERLKKCEREALAYSIGKITKASLTKIQSLEPTDLNIAIK